MIGLVEADLQDVIQPLIAALADPNPFVRGTAAMVLADYGQKAAEALPHLERLLAGRRVQPSYCCSCHVVHRTRKDRGTHTDLGRGVEQRGQNGSSSCCSGTWGYSGRWCFGDSVLVKALDDEDETVRLTVLNTLNNIGTAAAPATPVLVKILADSNDIIERGIAALALGSIGPPAEEAMPQLLTCLQEPGDSAARVYFRLKVADALWRISGAAEHLLAMGLKAVRSPEHGGCGGRERDHWANLEVLEVWPFLNFAGWWMMSTNCASFGSGVAGEDRGRSVISIL